MNLDELHRKLIAAARIHPPADDVPYAFAQRVLARVARAPAPGEWVRWGRALWYGAAACTAVALLTSVWTTKPVFGEQFDSNVASFSQEVEHNLLAPADDFDLAW